jgi:hypothetical protein
VGILRLGCAEPSNGQKIDDNLCKTTPTFVQVALTKLELDNEKENDVRTHSVILGE